MRSQPDLWSDLCLRVGMAAHHQAASVARQLNPGPACPWRLRSGRTPYHGRPEYGSSLDFVWLNKSCAPSSRIRKPLRWPADW